MSFRVMLAKFDCLASQMPSSLELLLCVVVNVSSTTLYKHNLRRSSRTREGVNLRLMASGSCPSIWWSVENKIGVAPNLASLADPAGVILAKGVVQVREWFFTKKTAKHFIIIT
jgi:hypothetical protein